ncbi:nuclear transport factor 2 family protein [Rhodocytophaga rosea]|uniref:Nuclear transport factor 2 family protein n=1 Tax=Rhodocytophaga rosea TaxID=2704465 RepID=A0A6C0GIE0_9BACT|nr:nuclear transport factor 2 family protein [Rhodocytophaga rosea]QHT67796.1 nuclear transport factor 2 family protein [Rhodocytophaga rosea]
MKSNAAYSPVSSQEKQILQAAYQAFNVRDVDRVLTLMSPDVDWPNGMEGGYVKGHAQVKAYWLRQWTMVNPSVQPVSFQKDEKGRIIVEVDQVVKDLSDNILLDGKILHVYNLEAGLIQHMKIRHPAVEK